MRPISRVDGLRRFRSAKRRGCRTRGGSRQPLRGFTLIELLVVIGIISVLLAILLPALKQARIAVLRISCASNMRQTLLTLQMYANDFHEFPVNCTPTDPFNTIDTADAAPFRVAQYFNGCEGFPSHWRAWLTSYNYGDPKVMGDATPLLDNETWRTGGDDWLATATNLQGAPPFYYFGPGTDVQRTADYYVGWPNCGWGGRPGRSLHDLQVSPLLTCPWYYYVNVGGMTTHSQVLTMGDSQPNFYDRMYDMNVGWTDGHVQLVMGSALADQYPEFFYFDWTQH
jgi:prepilin-type N-terminal cleavage/methylation domain-containing protein